MIMAPINSQEPQLEGSQEYPSCQQQESSHQANAVGNRDHELRQVGSWTSITSHSPELSAVSDTIDHDVIRQANDQLTHESAQQLFQKLTEKLAQELTKTLTQESPSILSSATAPTCNLQRWLQQGVQDPFVAIGNDTTNIEEATSGENGKP